MDQFKESDRFLKNTLKDYEPEGHSIQNLTLILRKDFEESKHSFLLELKQFEDLKLDQAMKIKDSLDRKSEDYYIYVGTGGYALVFWRLARYCKAQNMEDKAKDYLLKALNILDRNLQMLEGSMETNCGFFLSKTGLFTLRYIVRREIGAHEEAQKDLQQVLQDSKEIISEENQNEVLYGRAGFLYCLLLIQRCYPDVQLESWVEMAVMHIFKAGTNSFKRDILYFTFLGQPYFGAAHGAIGIFYLICEAILMNQASIKFSQKVEAVFVTSLERMLTYQQPDGNIAMLYGEDKASIIHWCHGAPGFISMLCAAYKLLSEKKYLDAALKAGEATWKQGLVKKGNCLCHGVAGNAYCLMHLFKVTGDLKWKHRAFAFGTVLNNQGFQRDFNKFTDYSRLKKGRADHPLSLMEGFAGEICMYADFLNGDSKEILFPGYDIN